MRIRHVSNIPHRSLLLVGVCGCSEPTRPQINLPSIAGNWAYTASLSRQVESGPLEACTIQGVTLVLDPLDPTSQELPRPFTGSASGGDITCSLGADQHVQPLSTTPVSEGGQGAVGFRFHLEYPTSPIGNPLVLEHQAVAYGQGMHEGSLTACFAVGTLCFVGNWRLDHLSP
jgi:hypothetical protein